jgi:hypothetical protein
MLSDSIASTSLMNPLPVDELSGDFEILLLIIVGHGEEALKRVDTWNQAKILYGLSNKYQVDSQRPWFSRICAQWAWEKPWDALFLACNATPMETDIIRSAISEGFAEAEADEIFDPAYFKEMKYDSDSDFDSESDSDSHGGRCWSTIRIGNITTEFGLKLGHLGLLAYAHTFASIKNTDPSTCADDESYDDYARRFVDNAKAVEEARDIVSVEGLISRCLLRCMLTEAVQRITDSERNGWMHRRVKRKLDRMLSHTELAE